MVNRRSDIDIKLTDFGVAKNMTAEGLKVSNVTVPNVRSFINVYSPILLIDAVVVVVVRLFAGHHNTLLQRY